MELLFCCLEFFVKNCFHILEKFFYLWSHCFTWLNCFKLYTDIFVFLGKKSLFFLFASYFGDQFFIDPIPFFSVGCSGDCSEIGTMIRSSFRKWDNMVHFSGVPFFQSQNSASLVRHASSFPLFGFSMEISVFFFIVSLFGHISLTPFIYLSIYPLMGRRRREELEEELEECVVKTPPENTGGVQPQEED